MEESDCASVISGYDSDSSSDTSSGCSGNYSDFTEEEPGSPGSSTDSSRTIGYPSQFDIQTGSSKELAIMVIDEEEDSPLRSASQSEEIIGLTMDDDLEEKPNSEPWILDVPPRFECDRRKRIANDFDIYHHPLIEFEATGKLPFHYPFILLVKSQSIAILN